MKSNQARKSQNTVKPNRKFDKQNSIKKEK